MQPMWAALAMLRAPTISAAHAAAIDDYANEPMRPQIIPGMAIVIMKHGAARARLYRMRQLAVLISRPGD